MIHASTNERLVGQVKTTFHKMGYNVKKGWILMMLVGPFLMALIPGIIILTLTWWFSKKGFSFFVRMLPGILTIIVAAFLFYIGFYNIRGFEGASYGILSFFFLIFAIISFVLGKKDITVGLN